MLYKLELDEHRQLQLGSTEPLTDLPPDVPVGTMVVDASTKRLYIFDQHENWIAEPSTQKELTTYIEQTLKGIVVYLSNKPDRSANEKQNVLIITQRCIGLALGYVDVATRILINMKKDT